MILIDRQRIREYFKADAVGIVKEKGIATAAFVEPIAFRALDLRPMDFNAGAVRFSSHSSADLRLSVANAMWSIPIFPLRIPARHRFAVFEQREVVMPHAIQADKGDTSAPPAIRDAGHFCAEKRQKFGFLLDVAHMNADMLNGQRRHIFVLSDIFAHRNYPCKAGRQSTMPAMRNPSILSSKSAGSLKGKTRRRRSRENSEFIL